MGFAAAWPNLVFTYFDEPLQRQVLARVSEQLLPGGYLVVGRHESLPATTGLVPDSARLGFFRVG
jgi:chemotaxis methyl-accepting protein methylase